MDDNAETPEGRERQRAKATSRTSLVERAAGKMVMSSPRRAAAGAPLPEELEAKLPLNDPPLAEVALADSDGAADADAGSDVRPATGAGPAAAPEPAAGTQVGAEKRAARTVKLDLNALESRSIITPRSKRSRTVEEFRLIKRMLLSHRWDESDLPGNAILVTSALPSEGKTTTAINLAMSIAAEEDLRVLLIDADFIKPDALRQLGVSASKGLIDVILDPRMDIADVILRTDIDKLSLIPSGPLHDRCTELLASARMNALIEEITTRYQDRILIFDSPPILATTESVTLASHMGQVVFVVQSERTKRESVNHALDLLGERERLGLVLNRTTSRFGNAEFGANYGSYYYGYGNR